MGAGQGQRVSGMVTQTPDERVFVIDAKTSSDPSIVTMAGPRPLIEYVQVQRRCQQGHAQVGAAVLVASAFNQDDDRIKDNSNQFLVETGVPLACLRVPTLLDMVKYLSCHPQLRNAVRWARLFCKCGVVLAGEFRTEAASAEENRLPRSTPDGSMGRDSTQQPGDPGGRPRGGRGVSRAGDPPRTARERLTMRRVCPSPGTLPVFGAPSASTWRSTPGSWQRHSTRARRRSWMPAPGWGSSPGSGIQAASSWTWRISRLPRGWTARPHSWPSLPSLSSTKGPSRLTMSLSGPSGPPFSSTASATRWQW